MLPEFSNSSKKNQNKLLRNKARLRTLGKNLVGSRSRVRSTSIVGESSSAVSYSEKNLINPESRVGSKYLEGRERKRGGPYIHRRQNFSSGSIYQIVSRKRLSDWRTDKVVKCWLIEFPNLVIFFYFAWFWLFTLWANFWLLFDFWALFDHF